MVDMSLIVYSVPPTPDATAPWNINWMRQQSPATEIIDMASTQTCNIYMILYQNLLPTGRSCQ